VIRKSIKNNENNENNVRRTSIIKISKW